MKPIIGAVSAIALIASVGMAAADETTATVEQVDETMRTITLDDGNTYELQEGVNIEGIFPGQEVTVSYEEENGDYVASSVEPAMD